MQSHLLLPQTYTDLPPSNLVSYKEMTSATDFLDDFSVSDWATLDFASITHPIYCELQFKGSHFQQLINTRHFPLLFSYSSSFIPKAPIRSVPKLDFSHSSEFYEAVESFFCPVQKTPLAPWNVLPLLLSLILMGTVGPDNPASWGFAQNISTSYTGTHPPVTDSWTCSFGQVKNSPLDENIINPVDSSNNTGEMRAIIELFDNILYYSDLPHGSTVIIHIDSTYVIRSLRGDQIPSAHHQLVELAQQYYTALRTIYYVELVKVLLT